MFDAKIRTLIDSPQTSLVMSSEIECKCQCHDFVWLFLRGIACALPSMGHGIWASVFLGNRIADGLDGAIARVNGLTDFGGF